MRVGERLRRAWRGFDLSWLGPLGLVVLFDDRVPELRWFALFFLVYPVQWVRGLVRLVLWNRRRPRNLPPLTLGRVVLYGVSLCLALFNPWIFVQSLLMAAGQLLAGFRTALRPPQRNARVNLAPPFTGVWTVARGGVEPDSSHSWGIPNQRYAYDLFVTDESGRSHEGNGRRPQDYYAFGRPILAPGDGVVVQVRDGERDGPWPGVVDPFARDARGNFVVIRHGPRAYSLLAHLQRGSVCVRAGETVREGQTIGRCGNSGHSTEPHLHVHVQDQANFYLAAGVPVCFGGQSPGPGDRVTGDASPSPHRS
jgi:hypothetical protein